MAILHGLEPDHTPTLREVALQCAACDRPRITIEFVGNAIAALCGTHLAHLRLAENLGRVDEFVAFINEQNRRNFR